MIFKKFFNLKKKKIAFVGLGGVGVSALLAGLNLNFNEIYGFDQNHNKLNFLKKAIKTDKKVVYSTFNKKILKKFENYFDYVIEASGSINGIQDGFKILNNNGNMIFASHPPKGKKIKIDPFDLIKGKKIFGSWGGGVDYEKNCETIFRLFRGIKNFDQLFGGKIYKFNNINKAIQDLKKEKVLRPIIKLF